MTTLADVKKLEAELTEQDINNIIAGWERTGEMEHIKSIKVSMDVHGATRERAMADVLCYILDTKERSKSADFYYNAYCL